MCTWGKNICKIPTLAADSWYLRKQRIQIKKKSRHAVAKYLSQTPKANWHKGAAVLSYIYLVLFEDCLGDEAVVSRWASLENYNKSMPSYIFKGILLSGTKTRKGEFTYGISGKLHTCRNHERIHKIRPERRWYRTVECGVWGHRRILWINGTGPIKHLLHMNIRKYRVRCKIGIRAVIPISRSSIGSSYRICLL